jgi:hypothetical protein
MYVIVNMKQQNLEDITMNWNQIEPYEYPHTYPTIDEAVNSILYMDQETQENCKIFHLEEVSWGA